MSDPASLPTVALVWGQFGPYHRDRCEALTAHLQGRYRVVGIEIASHSDLSYDWSDVGGDFSRETLYPGKSWHQTTRWQRLKALVKALGRHGEGPVFLCHYDQFEIFLTACWLRLKGRKVFGLHDSKFDDRPRSLWRELIKAALYLPYNGALASGARAKDYLRFLGLAPSRVALGYDTLSLDRVRRLAGVPSAPEGAPFAARQFLVIARFVEKKNLALALAAYDLYRQSAAAPRSLVMIGSGPLESELQAEVARRNLAGVRFTGFLQEKAIAEFLGQGLALVLPSTEEQWGLVINEALAMGLPILCSDNVGARDDLVRIGVNGYVVEPDNAKGLAHLMDRIATDEAEWRRLCQGSNALAPRADVARFADAVATLIGAEPADKGARS